MIKKVLVTLAVVIGSLGFANAATAESKVYMPDFPIVGGQVEVEITPFDLVTGAYQGRFVNQGINSFAVFEQDVATGKVTGKDLVRAAYMEYRATFEDLVGETTFIKDVDRFLETYNQGR